MKLPFIHIRRDEGRGGAAERGGLSRCTAASLAVHAGVLLLLSASMPAPPQPVLADPIYEVALVPWPRPNFEPPKPARATEVTPEKPVESRKPEEKPKPDVVPIQEKAAKQKPEPKPVVKEPPRKPPQKRPEEDRPDPASATPTPVPAEAEDGRVSLGRVDQKNFSENWYLDLVRQRLARAWEERGLRPGLNRAVVHFIIRRDGGVDEVTVVEPSGSGVYDRAALAAVHAASPMPVLPDTYPGAFLGISVDFEVQLAENR